MNSDRLSLALWAFVLVVVVPISALRWVGVLGEPAPMDILFVMAAIPAVLGIRHHRKELHATAETEGSSR